MADLAALAREMVERSRAGDGDSGGGDGFGERGLWLDVTWGGAGRVNGDLAAGCAAALSAVLAALGKKAGPEDTRTAAQRRHDALGEACRRLIAAGMVPGRTGQPTQILVHLGLGQLRNLPGGSGAEAAWRAAASGQHGLLTGPEAEAAACDATIVPIVTGHAGPAALDQLVNLFLASHRPQTSGATQPPAPTGGPAEPATGGPGPRLHLRRVHLPHPRTAGPRTAVPAYRCPRVPLSPRTAAPQRPARPGRRHPVRPRRPRRPPAGRPGHRPLASVSLPPDVGAATETIPTHLIGRAAATRHPHCPFPGCEQPASLCQIHHIIPRSHGGPTALHNLIHRLLVPRSSGRIDVLRLRD